MGELESGLKFKEKQLVEGQMLVDKEIPGKIKRSKDRLERKRSGKGDSGLSTFTKLMCGNTEAPSLPCSPMGKGKSGPNKSSLPMSPEQRVRSPPRAPAPTKI